MEIKKQYQSFNRSLKLFSNFETYLEIQYITTKQYKHNCKQFRIHTELQ